MVPGVFAAAHRPHNVRHRKPPLLPGLIPNRPHIFRLRVRHLTRTYRSNHFEADSDPFVIE